MPSSKRNWQQLKNSGQWAVGSGQKELTVATLSTLFLAFWAAVVTSRITPASGKSLMFRHVQTTDVTFNHLFPLSRGRGTAIIYRWPTSEKTKKEITQPYPQ